MSWNETQIADIKSKLAQIVSGDRDYIRVYAQSALDCITYLLRALKEKA